MKKSDYEKIIKLISNPDTLAEGLVELDTQLTNDEADYNKISESVNTLRDTNARLALRITTPVTIEPTEPEVDKTQELIDSIKADLKGDLSNGTTE